MGTFNDTDADTELVRTRKICPVPPTPTFVQGILALGREATPRQVWSFVYPMCVDGGWSCAPLLLLDYLRCSLTRVTETEGANPLLWEPHAPLAVLLDPVIVQRRHCILVSDFPVLGNDGDERAQGAIATEIGGLRSDLQSQHCEDEEAQRKERKAATSLEEFLGPVLTPNPRLLSLCNIVLLEERPGNNLFHMLSAAKKSQHLHILQSKIDEQKSIAQAQEDGLELVVSSALLQTAVILAMVMVNSMDAVRRASNLFDCMMLNLLKMH